MIAGADVPNVDGILFEAGRLWAVQNFSNQVTELRLSSDLASETVERIITSGQFEVPTAVARDGSRLVVVNAKFDTGSRRPWRVSRQSSSTGAESARGHLLGVTVARRRSE